jgi:hypothetical protein
MQAVVEVEVTVLHLQVVREAALLVEEDHLLIQMVEMELQIPVEVAVVMDLLMVRMAVQVEEDLILDMASCHLTETLSSTPSLGCLLLSYHH